MYGAAECTPPSAHKYSSLWLCTIVAPASMQPSASATISAGLRGTSGFTSFFTTPFSATSMMHGADIVNYASFIADSAADQWIRQQTSRGGPHQAARPTTR